jgi:signal transduction histidine kinase
LRAAVLLQVQTEGTSRDLAPILRDDIYRISRQALRNAFLHGQATQVEVEIRYDARQFRLRIRDNGKGIDPKVLESGAREGHYGLPSMRERARLVEGKLTVWSELNSGTEIELTIPAGVAYAKSLAARWPTPAFRSGLAALLATQRDVSLVAEACNGYEAVQQFRANRPDITLMT